MTDDYCVKCEQAIKISKDILSIFMKDPQPIKFKDGWYCEKCAKVKVEKARKKK